MGLFGGDSTKKTNITDQSANAGQGSVAASGGSSISLSNYTTTIDGGAVKNALDFSSNTVNKAFSFGTDSLDHAQTVELHALDSLTNGYQSTMQAMSANTAGVLSKVTTDSGAQMQQMFTTLAWALVGIAAVFLLRGKV